MSLPSKKLDTLNKEGLALIAGIATLGPSAGIDPNGLAFVSQRDQMKPLPQQVTESPPHLGKAFDVAKEIGNRHNS